MTRLVIAALAGLAAGLQAAPAEPPRSQPARVAVVVDASGGPARVRAATAEAARRGAPLRAPRALNQQLAVTARLAAEGYGTLVGFGIDERVAIAPLRDRVRYVDAGG